MKRHLDNSHFLGTLALAGRRRSYQTGSRIKFLAGVASLLISLSIGQADQSVTLAWNANSESDIAGHVLRYRTRRGTPAQSINVGNATTATVSNLANGTTYFFTVAARNTIGLESSPSSEVSHTTPPLGAYKLTVVNGTGSGIYSEGTRVRVSANQPVADQQFDRWARDYQILENPSRPATTALMLFRDLTIEATYKAPSANDKIRYWPRQGFGARMGRRL